MTGNDTFVGRAAELEHLLASLRRAADGAGGIVILSGEPGIGKTRLATEFERCADRAGILVGWGRVWESGGAPPYWPWIQAVRALMGRFSGADDRAAVQDLLARFHDQGESAAGGSASRPRFYGDVTQLLRRVATRSPLLLILDDIHAADIPTLLLLETIGESLAEMPLLIVGTQRDSAVDFLPEVGRLLDTVAARHTRLPLQGLDLDGVADLVARSNAAALAPQSAAALHAATGGNPFFIEALLQSGAGRVSIRDNVTRVPEPVRAAVARRIEALDEPPRVLLRYLALIGNEVDADTVGPLLGNALSGADLSHALSAAVAAGVLRREPTDATRPAQRFRFAHGLVRQVLHDATPLSERARLHLRLGDSLDALHGRDGDAIYQIAHHYLQGSVLDKGERALPSLRQAAARAYRALAFEEAARLLEHALELLDLGQVTATERCAVLLDLGQARWKAGAFDGAREAFHRTVAVAREHRIVDALAHAAVALADQPVTIGTVDWPLVRLLEEALAWLPADPSALRVELLTGLAYALYSAGDAEERRAAISRDALAMARDVGDATLLGNTLERHCWTMWGPQTVEERLRSASELVAVATQTADDDLRLRAYVLRLVARCEICDTEGADADLEAARDLAYRIGEVDNLGAITLLQAMRALMDGRFADGERLMSEAFQAARPNDQNRMQNYAAQLWVLRSFQGRLGELEGAVRGFIDELPGVATWRAALAVLCVEQERFDEARRELDALAAADFRDLPHDLLWLTTVMGLAQTAARLGDERRARPLYDLLLPYAQRNIVLSGGVASYGAAALYLGLLAAVMEAWPEAISHFETALALNGRMRARPALALTYYEYARALWSAPPAARMGLNERIAWLAEQAVHLAAELGLDNLAARATILRRAIASGVPLSARIEPGLPALPSEPTDDAVVVLRNEGSLWTICQGERVIRLKDYKGLHYLAALLRSPGEELHVLDVAATDPESAPETTAARPGLRAQRLRRMNTLRAELTEAEAQKDTARSEAIRRALTTLGDEMAHGADDDDDEEALAIAERARVNVTRSINKALKRIHTADEALGHSLMTSIHTGRFCSFRPDPKAPLRWRA